LAGLGAAASLGFGQAWNFEKVNPKGTYLRDSQATQAATAIQLSQTRDGGHFMEIRTVGWFNRALDNPLSHNISNQGVAVFSEDGHVNPNWTFHHRVDLAEEAGNDFYTLPTWIGNNPTDIDEDFGIGPVAIRVELPAESNFLLITPYDNGFWNNGDDFSVAGADPRGFGVEWRIVGTVPEPGTLAVVGLGLAGLGKRKRRYK
jgi:hypothetical protein